MDIIIEGKITAEEGMGEVIQTVIDLKSPNNPILRISANGSDLQGRIAFSQGGNIIGGRINNTEEAGYDAIRKLLSIIEGNYAILDPGRQQTPDCNQSLWIKAESVLEHLPNLPLTADGLLGVTPEQLQASTVKHGSAGMDLKAPAKEAASTTVGSVKSKARTFDQKTWFLLQLVIWTFVFLIIGGAALYFFNPQLFGLGNAVK